MFSPLITTISARAQIDREQGFDIVRLTNGQVTIAIVPELGAKLLSLRLLSSEREWLWRPPGALRLFRNTLGDDFTRSTLIGADECVPTIEPCNVGGRELPDHGEAWSAAWSLESAALERGVVRTSLRLPRSPLTITRAVALSGAAVVLDYELVNHSSEPQPFLWALHPLLSFEEGDRLRLAPGVRTLRVESARNPDAARGAAWTWPSPQFGVDLEHLRLADNDGYAKFFAGPLDCGWAALENARTRDRLEFRWPVSEHPFLGVWLTRGGWKGFHHPAIEPTNAPCDGLAEALKAPTPALFVPPDGARRWQVLLDLTPIPQSSAPPVPSSATTAFSIRRS
ncbi:MAG: hypothetical protein ACREF9_07480 [Opitutaceae bacterium]